MDVNYQLYYNGIGEMLFVIPNEVTWNLSVSVKGVPSEANLNDLLNKLARVHCYSFEPCVEDALREEITEMCRTIYLNRVYRG